MENNEKKYQECKCGYNCTGCLCSKKKYNGGNKDPEKCEKEDKKAE